MLKAFRKNGEKGFTLIELMIVIAIIGILAAIAIPQFLQYRIKSYNAAANTDIKNAYTAAQAYFIDNPAANLTTDMIKSAGYTQTNEVTLTGGGTMGGLSLTTTHARGDKTFTCNANGKISD